MHKFVFALLLTSLLAPLAHAGEAYLAFQPLRFDPRNWVEWRLSIAQDIRFLNQEEKADRVCEYVGQEFKKLAPQGLSFQTSCSTHHVGVTAGDLWANEIHGANVRDLTILVSTLNRSLPPVGAYDLPQYEFKKSYECLRFLDFFKIITKKSPVLKLQANCNDTKIAGQLVVIPQQ